jgi:hypothetical protein
MIVLACVDLGRFAYNHIALTNAARAGAAYAMMNNYSSSTQGTWSSDVTAAAKAEMSGQAGYNSSSDRLAPRGHRGIDRPAPSAAHGELCVPDDRELELSGLARPSQSDDAVNDRGAHDSLVCAYGGPLWLT